VALNTMRGVESQANCYTLVISIDGNTLACFHLRIRSILHQQISATFALDRCGKLPITMSGCYNMEFYTEKMVLGRLTKDAANQRSYPARPLSTNFVTSPCDPVGPGDVKTTRG
jgi:hypothetical protein